MKTTINFLISVLFLGIYFGGGYYYFENHTLLGSFSNRQWLLYSVDFSILAGGVSLLYALFSKQGWNSFFYMISMLLNFSFTLGVLYIIVEYGTFFVRGKILLYCSAIVVAFVLQLLVFFAMRKKSKMVSK